MKKSVVIIAFLVLLVGSAWLYRVAGPMRSDLALGRAFAALRDARDFSGIAVYAALPGDGSQATASQAAGAMRVAFKLALPDAATGVKGSGEAIFTFVGASEDGADAFVEIRELPDGQAFIRIDRMPLSLRALSEQPQDKAWWKVDRSLIAEMFLSEPVAAADKSVALDEDGVTARWTFVRDAISGNDLFVDGGRGYEVIDRHLMQRFMLGLRREAATAVFVAVKEALLGRELSAEEKTSAAAQVDAAAANLTIWLDARDGRPFRIMFDVKTTGGPRRSLVIAALDLKTPVTVEVPPDAKTLDAAPVMPIPEETQAPDTDTLKR